MMYLSSKFGKMEYFHLRLKNPPKPKPVISPNKKAVSVLDFLFSGIFVNVMIDGANMGD